VTSAQPTSSAEGGWSPSCCGLRRGRRHSDGGGKRPAALNPIHGADKILRFLAGIARKNPALQAIEVRAATINGLAGFVLREQDGAIDTMAFEHRDGRIVAIYITRNPDKLRHVRF
jgi:RNA polymerase sigma-70 factor (ECF subfamily)